ncbi:MAG: hypothetical protein C4324_11660 [Blastocatellia bacterium]
MKSIRRVLKDTMKDSRPVIKRYLAGESIAVLLPETGLSKQTLHKSKGELVRREKGEVKKKKLER